MFALYSFLSFQHIIIRINTQRALQKYEAYICQKLEKPSLNNSKKNCTSNTLYQRLILSLELLYEDINGTD